MGMKTGGKVVVLGSTNTDMVIAGRKLPAPGETVCGGRFMMNPGGKGANQAVAAARLAAAKGACTFIAKVGDDLFGRETAARMKKDGIRTRLVVDEKEPSGTALILVDAKGQNVISVALGANGTLAPQDVAPFKKDIEGAAVLVMQLETPVETVEWAAKTARAAGAATILNPAPARKLPRSLYPLIDWITPNETEAEILTGVKVTDAASAAEAAAVLKKRGVGHVAITMGSKGVFYGDITAPCGRLRPMGKQAGRAEREPSGRLFPCRKVKAVDCVAAGDTFNGAFAVALAEGRNCEEAVAFAQKAAAIAVTRPGAQSSIPFRKEIA